MNRKSPNHEARIQVLVSLVSRWRHHLLSARPLTESDDRMTRDGDGVGANHASALAVESISGLMDHSSYLYSHKVDCRENRLRSII